MHIFNKLGKKKAKNSKLKRFKMQNMVEVRKSHAFDYGKLTAYLD